MTGTEQELCQRVAELAGAESVLRLGEPLARRTTLRVGGRADCYVEPADESGLANILRLCRAEGVPVFVMGRGSNLLIRDGGIRGLVICLVRGEFGRIEVNGGQLRCGAGVRLKLVVQEARRAGLGGLEFLEGIPGSVGGALRMNAGAMGSWTFDAVERIRVMDREGRVSERGRGEVEVGYRDCSLLRDHIALGAVFRGERVSRQEIEDRGQRFNQKRWSSQPAAASAGCIFKNPEALPAGRLIDELGLKGARIGGAVVSDVHANFIVNEGQATANDVLRLIAMIQEQARLQRGIELETEVEIIGEATGTGA